MTTQDNIDAFESVAGEWSDQKRKSFRWFLLGFDNTQEGFNGECAFDNCVPWEGTLADAAESNLNDVIENIATPALLEALAGRFEELYTEDDLEDLVDAS